MWAWRLWVVTVVMVVVTRTHCYYFQPGYAYHYTYESVNTMLTHRNVTTVLKFNIQCVEEEEDGGRTHILRLESLVQFMEGGEVYDNPRKLDLTKIFIFVSNAAGGVTVVHVHPDDHKELLIIKKAIVSLFSVHVQLEEGQDSWNYNAEDLDHLGRLQHTYRGQRNKDGFILHREHSSEDKIHRLHHKTMHYDHQGTLQFARAKDHVLVKNAKGGVDTMSATEEIRETSSSGDFPDIEAAAHVSVKYTGKRLVKQDDATEYKKLVASMHLHPLQTKHVETTHDLADVQENITKAWECIHFYYQPDNENRTNCVNKLRGLLSGLQADHYSTYVSKVLAQNCSQEDTVCEDDRHIMLDIVARMGDVLSQDLLVQHVLSRRPPSHEDLRRVFIHCAALKSPSQRLLLAVEGFCFGETEDHTGSRTLNRTQGRACLAVGSLAKHLASSGHQEEAERLVQRLETWLDLHGQGDIPVTKRDTRHALHGSESDVEKQEHISKGVILHAVGNGGLQRSRGRLIQHAAPNSGHPLWRRAAVDSLRHFSCKESALALFTSMMEDEMPSVQRVALGVFVNHPHRHSIMQEQEDKLLSHNYTYPAVSRVKRSIFEDVLFQFKIASPSFEWRHSLGNRVNGGNFGLKFHNSIEGLFRVLSGYVNIDIHDELHADVYMLSKQFSVELIHFMACYKGRLSYNMNIVKDFTVDLMKDINSAFDHIIGSVMEPMEQLTIKLMAEYQDPNTGQPISAFQDLADAVKELPQQTGSTKQAAEDFKESVDQLGILPTVARLQAMMPRAQTLLEDIHTEASELFTNIDEESRIALPFAEKEIKGAINSVLGVLDKVKDYPNQALSKIESAKMRYQLSIMRIMEAEKVIKQAFSFVFGGRSSWNNAREELSSLKKQTEVLVAKLQNDFARRRRRQAGSSDNFSPCATVELDGVLVKLYNSSDNFVQKLDIILNHSPARLQRALEFATLQKETLKAGFASFREAIDMVKSRIQALFGMKFHYSFPNIRRDCDGHCGCGYYPTDCNRYGHPGVDLVWNEQWKVPSPVTGMVYVENGTTVKIIPKTADLSEYEIYVSNIELHANYSREKDGFFIQAGQVLGTSLGANGCNKGHIHVAMRRTSNQTGLCHYVNPTAFLNNSNPKIDWHQECNEFTFRHVFQTTDFSSLTDGFAPFMKQLKRYALDSLKDLAGQKLKDLIPDGSFLAPFRDIGLDFLKHNNISQSVTDLKNLFVDKVNAAKDFLRNIKIPHVSFKDLLDLAALKNSLQFKLPNLRKLSLDLKNRLKIPRSLPDLKSLSTGALSRLWKKLKDAEFSLPSFKFPNGTFKGDLSLPSFDFGDISLPSLGFPSFGNFGDLFRGLKGLLSFKNRTSEEGTSGSFFNMTRLLDRLANGKDKLLAKLKQKIREKACPTLAKVLKKQGSPCIPHDDCSGLTCNISFQRKHMTGWLHLDIRVNRANRTVDVGNHTLVGDVADTTLDTELKLFGSFDVKLNLNTSWSGDDLWLSLSLQACGPNMCCLPEVTLARNLSFSEFNISSLWSSFNASDFDFEILSLDEAFKASSDLDVESKELTDSMIGIQDLLENELNMSLPSDVPVKFTTEFMNPEEFADGGSYPLAGQKSEFYARFFHFVYPIPLGPAMLIAEFSAGGAVGFQFSVKVQSADSFVKSTLTPWVAAKIEARVSLNIWIFSFGIDLHAYIMRTRFPLSLTTYYTKQPVIQTKQLDMELIPLEFRVVAWFRIRIEISFKIFRKRIRIVIFDKTWSKLVWQWRASGYRGTVWKKEGRKDDLGPPQFPYCDRVDDQCSSPARGRRSALPGYPVCLVKQLKDRHPRDSAFMLDFSVDDEDSDVTVSYTVGDYPGGTNVKGSTPMRGTTLVVVDKLVCGKPLFFTVNARNSEGLSTAASCSLPTYDCTFPDGRTDMASKCTSHFDQLSASVIAYEDSKLKTDKLFYALGFSPGSYGHELVDWSSMKLETTQLRSGIQGSLRSFTSARLGRLNYTPERSFLSPTSETCADECLAMTKCVSFSYNARLFTCELQPVTESVHAQRLEDGQFYTYERLGKGYSSSVELTNLQLHHGVRYYINGLVENVLGYQSVLTSEGVMVDHTSPEPGYLGEGAIQVNQSISNCSASVIQRCIQPAASLQHRTFIDSRGGRTVFNGNRRRQELLFTMDNHHASANWDGFNDGECGIYSYTFAVGTTVCGNEISDFVDPHAALSHQDDWSHVGLAKDLHLAEGSYFVTVQAVSDIEHGGDLVTTVCHSVPFNVDTTPPVLHSVDEMVFDDGFHTLAIYYTASDNLSGIHRLEFGLGRTKYDVMVRKYLPFDLRGNGQQTYLLNEEFHMSSGVPAWIRLKVVDQVGLWVAGHGSYPVLLDSTAPVPGRVLDGSHHEQDACCQANHTTICVQWSGFEDQESHIDSYTWGVGLSPGKDDVLAFHKLPSTVRQSCMSQLSLAHNTTYFSTIIAHNRALNQKSVNVSSDGVLVDQTSPVAGTVVDGTDINADVDFTSETSMVSSTWTGFHDPETDIAGYTVSIHINNNLYQSSGNILGEQFVDYSAPLNHGDIVHATVTAVNRAGSKVTVASNGQTVDHTPPEVVRLTTAQAVPFQNDDTSLHFVWEFQDFESGLAEYRFSVFQLLHGTESLFWPAGSSYHSTKFNITTKHKAQRLDLQSLSLVNGASYFVRVTTINHARLSTTKKSAPVTVDSTKPVVEGIQISLPGEEEAENENGEIEHIEGERLHASWKAHDFESGIRNGYLCIGLLGSDCLTSTDVTTLDSASLALSTFILDQSKLHVSTEENKIVYQVQLMVINDAGLSSSVAVSKPVLVLRGNIAGAVLDGRSGVDEDFTNDKSGIAVMFYNFSSEACGIEAFDWGVGSSPCATDVLPFSDIGLVKDPNADGSGRAHANILLMEGKTYYATVRARTGHSCHEPYIVSCSDGITIDSTPPDITVFLASTVAPDSLSSVPAEVLTSQDVVYQATDSTLKLGWSITDSSGLNMTQLTVGRLDNTADVSDVAAVSTQPFPLSFTLSLEDSVYSSLHAVDGAGNKIAINLPVAMFDSTSPTIQDFLCTDVVSSRAPVVSCTWTSLLDRHSAVEQIQFGLGRGPSSPDLRNFTEVHLQQHLWKHDVTEILELELVGESEFYIIFRVFNKAGLQTVSSVRVVNDHTAPLVDEVVIVTTPGNNAKTKQRCQTSTEFIELEIVDPRDDESGVQSIQIALGTARGMTDIHPFQTYSVHGGVHARGHLALATGTTVYATARVTNGVGLYSVVMSDGVVISPEPRLEVRDGPGMEDADSQADLNLIQGQWVFSDECPVTTAQWSATELGSGRVVHNFTDMPSNIQAFYDDTVSLENLKMYVSHVRITDALGRTFEAYSDGVMVSIGTPDTAPVWEGAGAHDMDFQESLDIIEASWGAFGNSRSALPSDHVTRYEAAVGTDPLETVSRSNVHGFVDVGLAQTHTFHGLNLTAKTVTYYITVRAHSASNTFSESSSDGIKAGFSGDISAGRVDVDPFQSDLTQIRVSWAEFKSDMGELRYYAGVSTVKPQWGNLTHECQQLLNTSFAFDVMPLQPVNGKATETMTGLNLGHSGVYFVSVVAEDLMSHCSAVVSNPILVDTTPPVSGELQVKGYDADTVMFVHTTESIMVSIDSFLDSESGVKTATIDLVESNCGMSSPQDVTILTRTVQNESHINLSPLSLDEDAIYLIKMTVANGARLQTQSVSKALLVSTMLPAPGTVKLGTNWTADSVVFSSQQDKVHGVIAVQPTGSLSSCSSEKNHVSAQTQGDWTKLSGQFSHSCAHVEDSYISLLVQHNPHLTAMNRGAAQLEDLTLTEGRYSFHSVPASGEHVLTGLAITASTLQPPFLVQNRALMSTTVKAGCASGNQSCLQNETFIDTGYGIGLSFLQYPRSRLLLWVHNQFRLEESFLDIDFDPFSRPAEYTFNVRKTMGGSWEVAVLVDGVIKQTVNGLALPDIVTLSLYTWNVDDYFHPVTDPFHPYVTEFRTTAVVTPLQEKPLCSYGSSFQDGQNGIKEVWAGISDSLNNTANVAPYTLVEQFCTPCLRGCQNICSASCKHSASVSALKIIPVSLTNLSLDSASDAVKSNPSSNSNTTGNSSESNTLDSFRLPMYYLDIKTVSHSGLEAHSKSSALTVDSTPPSVVSLQCTDPSYAEDEPVDYIGTNETVGVQWDVSEDISDVTEQWISLGTSPGLDNLVPWVQVDRLAASHLFSGLGSLLADETSYYVSLRVVNAASLSAVSSAPFTVSLQPPDMSNATLPHFDNDTVVETISGRDVAFMDTTDRLSVALPTLDNEDPSVQFIAWSIGTQPGLSDVLPKVIVANTNVTTVGIVNGQIETDGYSTNITVGDYARSSFGPSNGSGALFQMEPGRCLWQQIHSISRSHRETVMELSPICVRRGEDQLVRAGRSVVNMTDGTQLQLSLQDGAVTVGTLSEDDSKAMYGSEASSRFLPFIQLPDSGDPTSRSLRGRLSSTEKPHIFMSPVGDMQQDQDMNMTYVVPSSVNVPIGFDVRVLFWVAERGSWMSVQEVCLQSQQSFDPSTGILNATVCSDVFATQTAVATQRSKRSTSGTVSLSPRMFILAVVDPTIVNLPPSVNSVTLTLVQGNGISTSLTYWDSEDDVLSFSVLGQPQNGTASITSDGILSYTPGAKFSGYDQILIQATEVLDAASVAAGLVPNIVNITIPVTVTNVNDPPEIFFLPAADITDAVEEVVVDNSNITGISISVLVEGNATLDLHLGLIVFGDIDIQDSFVLLNHTLDDENATFALTSGNPNVPQLKDMINRGVAYKLEAQDIWLSVNDSYHGNISFQARVKDGANTYSVLLSVDVYVLISPCIHGYCQALNSTDNCTDSVRASSFDTFWCQCLPGYEGDWCETETNECLSNTCSLLSDCKDLIDGYHCDINILKMAAVILSIIVALIIIAALLWRWRENILRFFRRKKQVEPYSLKEDDMSRPSTSASDRSSLFHSSEDLRKILLSNREPTVPPASFRFGSDPFFAFAPVANPTQRLASSKMSESLKWQGAVSVASTKGNIGKPKATAVGVASADSPRKSRPSSGADRNLVISRQSTRAEDDEMNQIEV